MQTVGSHQSRCGQSSSIAPSLGFQGQSLPLGVTTGETLALLQRWPFPLPLDAPDLGDPSTVHALLACSGLPGCVPVAVEPVLSIGLRSAVCSWHPALSVWTLSAVSFRPLGQVCAHLGGARHPTPAAHNRALPTGVSCTPVTGGAYPPSWEEVLPLSGSDLKVAPTERFSHRLSLRVGEV